MKKVISILVVFILVLSGFSVYAIPETRGKSAIVSLMDSDQIIYEKNIDEKISPSGLTKLFTALTAYDLKDVNETIIVAENIGDYTSKFEITAQLKPGEMLTLYDVLGAMVVGSANDAAYQTAITCSGSIEAFVEQMNKKAKEMNLKNTHFTNPTGVYDKAQYTTAYDMLKIYKSICKNDLLYKIVSNQRWIIEPTNVSKRRIYWTNNHLQSTYYETKYYYVNSTSGKISSSSEGGYSAVVSAVKGGINIICVVLNSQLDSGVNYSLTDAVSLFDYVFDNYSPLTIVKENELICEAKIKNSSSSSYTLVNTKTQLKGVIKKTDSADKIEKKVDMPEYIYAPLKKGQVVGKANYIYEGNPVGTVDLVVQEDINFNVFKYIINGIIWFFSLKSVKTVIMVILMLIIIFAGLFVYLVNKALKRQRDLKLRSKKRGKKY